tara:strand:- start:807 stop:2018 length:1212 start_codon:yes stop_codon:yes gene_type:complete
MKYQTNNLFIERIKAQNLAKRFGTPIYCYSYEKLKKNIINFRNNFKSFSPMICFSVKANSNVNLLREIKKFNCGADVVSIGEMMKVLKAGFNPKKIVFSGVGKTFEELSYAINKKILLINIESEEELIEIEKIAKKKRKLVDIGIRLNPNTDAKTLKKISTGKKENKFGVTEKAFFNLLKYSKKSKYLKVKCLSVHIGSQITSYKPYQKTLGIIKKIINKSNYKFEYIDLGGGMGITYENEKKLDYKKYNNSIKNFLKKNKTKIIFEPGRSIIGNTGILISKVIYIKKTQNKDFIILDSGMNDLIRPALYGSKHKIIPLKRISNNSNRNYEFVGPICESTDKFLNIKKFQKLKKNDLIAICDVGAYGMSLSSNYNVRTKPIELLIKGSKVRIIKKRQRLKDIV